MKSAELSAALARARLDIDDELRESRKIGAALRTSGLLDGEPAALDRRTRRVLKAQEALLDRMARPPAGEYVDVKEYVGAALRDELKSSRRSHRHHRSRHHESTARVPADTRAAFEVYDRNASGALNVRELRDALAHMGLDGRDAPEVLRRYDEYPDGRLDLREFETLVDDLRAASKRRSKVPHGVRDAFKAFDRNHSGFLNVRELRSALARMGVEGLSERGAQAVLRRYDARPDGKLDLDEFHDLTKDLLKARHTVDRLQLGLGTPARPGTPPSGGRRRRRPGTPPAPTRS